MTKPEFTENDFYFSTMEEELAVAERCSNLLQLFYKSLQEEGSMAAERASDLAYSADYYLRDYVIDFLRCNILKPEKGQVRYFAANWYITHTLDPDMTILAMYLESISALYHFFQQLGFITSEELGFISDEAADTAFYQQRLDEFVKLSGDGYDAWNKACRMETAS